MCFEVRKGAQWVSSDGVTCEYVPFLVRQNNLPLFNLSVPVIIGLKDVPKGEMGSVYWSALLKCLAGPDGYVGVAASFVIF